MTKITRTFSLFLLLALLLVSASAQERFLKPVDEAELDPSFKAFRSRLVAAAERRDSAYILSILDPRIRLSFGDDAGVAAFKRMWKIGSRDSRFWAEFLPVIKNGGSFVRDGDRRTGLFYAPYTYSVFPDDLDGFDYAAVFGTDVNLRKAPDTRSEVVARLSHNIVRIEPETVPKSGRSEYPGWFQVTTIGGLTGYIKKELVRRPVDYRAGFEKKRGRWVMVTFVAGD